MSDANLSLNDSNNAKSEERWCNQLAGEILLPKDVLEGVHGTKATEESVNKLAREAGCSVLVVLHSLFDANFLSWSQYQELYGRELSAIAERGSTGKQTGGGDFYKTLPLRNSPTFRPHPLFDHYPRKTAILYTQLGIKPIFQDLLLD